MPEAMAKEKWLLFFEFKEAIEKGGRAGEQKDYTTVFLETRVQ